MRKILVMAAILAIYAAAFLGLSGCASTGVTPQDQCFMARQAVVAASVALAAMKPGTDEYRAAKAALAAAQAEEKLICGAVK